MGGGFGGCAVVRAAARADQIGGDAIAGYAERAGREAWAIRPKAADGAGVLEPPSR